ncbi:glycosyltransferase family 2 protein [Patescibacteria group bacterium]|nr:glycosyltransferase family 2 protein [Patescibacteria group bacterium]
MRQDIKLSIIIPCYNEASRLTETLLAVDKYLSQQSYKSEIIVVDDSSTDTTIDIIKSFYPIIHNLRCIRHRHNQGKGGAVKTGMLGAYGRWMLFMDADLATPIEELDKFWQYTTNYDVIFASRHLLKDSIKTRQPWYRHAFGRTANLFIQAMLLPGIKDTQCGFKLFSANAAEDLFTRLSIYGFSFDIEILTLADTLDYPIKETPVIWYDKPHGTVNVLRDGFRAFADVIRVKSRITQSLLNKSAYTQKA